MASLMTRAELIGKLDAMGITLVDYDDPVDGGKIACLEVQQVSWLVNFYEQAMVKAAEARPAVIRIEAEPAITNLMDLAVISERERIIKMLAGPHPADSGLDSATLAAVVAILESNEGPGRWTTATQYGHIIVETGDEPPKVCACGATPHGESLTRPASLWVN